MVKIRLTRLGKKNDPFYRIIAVDASKKRESRALAVFGFWNPREKDLKIDKKGIDVWVKKGAQISPGVQKLLNK